MWKAIPGVYVGQCSVQQLSDAAEQKGSEVWGSGSVSSADFIHACM